VAEIPEFASGPPIWMVARLIRDEIDGRQRLGVVWAWTADAENRVWWTECPDCGPDLGTSLDVFDLDRNTTILRVFDYSRRIASVGSASGFGQLAWRPVPGNPQYLEIARGRSRTEVVLRWSGVACDATWRTNVRFFEDSVGIEFYPASRDDCESNRVTRRVVVRFDEPIDLDRVNSGFCCG
jgi:hypothetical protein